jgi:hypothetical protein
VAMEQLSFSPVCRGRAGKDGSVEK